MPRLLATTALIGAFFIAPALAQTMAPANSPPAAAQKGRIGAADRSFAHDAAVSGMAEIELGKLAEQKGAATSIKDFGREMVSDHTKADDRLAAAAKREGIVLPTEIDAEHKTAYDWIGKQTGADFDRLYIRNAVDDHQKQVPLFERESRSGENPALKRFAATTLPAIQHHLQMAQAIEAEMNRNAPQAANPPAPAESSGASMPPRAAKPVDTSADRLNREELNRIENR